MEKDTIKRRVVEETKMHKPLINWNLVRRIVSSMSPTQFATMIKEWAGKVEENS